MNKLQLVTLTFPCGKKKKKKNESHQSIVLSDSPCTMYANCLARVAPVPTKLFGDFVPHFFSGMKIVTAFKCIFEETKPKLSVNFGNLNSQDFHKNQYPSPICNFGFTEPQYSEKC